ncbi:MAG: MFS transporter [Acidobacteriia bacterium]|nr:MFS transporter [Terriglobia bacterium]
MTAAPRVSTAVKWTICVVAAIGFLFDIYTVLVAPLILRPALTELGHLTPGTPAYADWAGRMFWIPPLVGGFFGLIGGYLTDIFGRRRILVWSILLYSLAAVAAGYSTSLQMLLMWRTISFIGVCVEFVAAVAWLAELFTEPKQREAVLGWTQAFSSLGGVCISGANYLANHYAMSLPAIYGDHKAWRYTLISAVVPAIPLMIIRPFLPESPQWERLRETGLLKRPSIGELFQPAYRKTTLVTTLLFACGYAAAFGAIQQAPQITPGLAQVVKSADDAAAAAEAKAGHKLTPPERGRVREQTIGQMVSAVQGTQELGGLAGRIALAILAMVIVSRRALLRVFLVPGLIIVPFVFYYPATHDLDMFRMGMFFAGFCTVAQLSYWGNYLPRVYPVHLRGTGEGFAANVGGRMLGTSAAYVTSHLQAVMPGGTAPMRLAYAAAAVALGVYLFALTMSFFLPQPPEKIGD